MADQEQTPRKDRIPADTRQGPPTPHDTPTLAQDGSVLGGGGGAVRNPTAEGATRDLPIGGSTGTLRELGQHREQLPGGGGQGTGEKGTSGMPGGDVSGVGGGDDDAWSGEGPRYDRM